MRPVALSDELAVGEVPEADQIAILAKAGFRALLNVQPDGEISRFPDAMTTRKAAEAAGLAYAHVPVESRRPSEDRIKHFADAMAALPKPIYAYCYSGGRAAAAWALATAATAHPATIVQALETAGYDTSSLRGALERRKAGLPAFEVLPPVVIAASAKAPEQRAAAAASGIAPATEVETAISPPTIILPRAASAGGFAVPG
jgi:uncharacterized protein (TIGR01244 family)